MIGIYKIENLVNHKFYIGKSNDIYKRFGDHKRKAFYTADPSYNYPLYKAIRKYGIDNFNFSILEECSEDELNKKEEYWIKFYNTYLGPGYNQTPGGEGSPKISHEKMIELYNIGYSIDDLCQYFNASQRTIINILHSYNLGYLTQEEKNKLQKPRPVCQYDLNGNFLQEYYSAGEATQKLLIDHPKANSGSILKACNSYTTAYGFLWIFKNDKNADIKNIINKINVNEKNRLEHVSKAVLKRCSRPVNQYMLDGKYIRSYSSASEARREINNQHISDVCNGVWLTAGKYYWRYVSDDFPRGKDLDINSIQDWRNKEKEKRNGRK